MRKDSAFSAFAAKAPAAYPAFAPAAAPLYPHADQSIDTAYRTHFGQHHNLDAPITRTLRILRVQQHLVRHCAYLHHFIFRHSGLFQHPTSRKRAVTRKVPVVVDIVL